MHACMHVSPSPPFIAYKPLHTPGNQRRSREVRRGIKKQRTARHSGRYLIANRCAVAYRGVIHGDVMHWCCGSRGASGCGSARNGPSRDPQRPGRSGGRSGRSNRCGRGARGCRQVARKGTSWSVVAFPDSRPQDCRRVAHLHNGGRRRTWMPWPLLSCGERRMFGRTELRSRSIVCSYHMQCNDMQCYHMQCNHMHRTQVTLHDKRLLVCGKLAQPLGTALVKLVGSNEFLDLFR